MHDMCGVVGISSKDPCRNVAKSIYYALYALQHRGQESAGITVYDGKVVRTHKAMGLVSEVFDNANIQNLIGTSGIGHVRYSTAGESIIANSQPLHVRYKDGAIAVAHNGNLVNAGKLKEELEVKGEIFHSTSDTEIIVRLFLRELLKRQDPVEAVRAIMRKLMGAYSVVFLVGNTIIGVRDPLGIKPLCIGKTDTDMILASESVAIDTLNGTLIRDVRPGEMITIRDGEMRSCQITHQCPAHCVFEYIYFARPDSIMDGRLVYDVRVKMGATLADEYSSDADTVTPIPDSGITLAIGYHQRSGIDYRECLMKNRYIGRTFIMPGQEMREIAVRLKMNTMRPNIENKRIITVDDSIVRGTTSRRIVDMLRNDGAKEVHVRIGSPPIIAPCYMGIDMATRDELIAAHKSVAGVEAVINADSLGYISHKGLVEAIGIPENQLCMGCLTGVYPIEIPGEKCRLAQIKITEYIKK
ncbi:MAG: amidophosphoribosyltransferase [Methanotrichaceae archaeon]